jgi:prepilin-type processing-associated H-X9-DG protein
MVLAVITLLAGLLLPTLQAVRDRARQTTCLMGVQQLSRAHLLYLQDWDERFPFWYFRAPLRPEPWGSRTYWTEFLQPYLRCEAVLRDPSALWEPEVLEEQKLASYALATWEPGRGAGSKEFPYWNWPGPRFSVAEVRRPSETITLLDGFTTVSRISVDLQRHSGGLNVSFVDGHACWLRRQEFFRTATDGQGFYWLYYATADR